jgi:triosephosphate isomerase
MAAAPSSLASSHLSRLADLRRAAAVATPAVPQQLRIGCSRRRAQRVVAMAGSGKVRRRPRCFATRL